MDYVHQFFEQQEVRRNDTQACTDHDSVISVCCECIAKYRFRGLALIDVQCLHAVTERFQLCLIRFYCRVDFRCGESGHRRFAIINYVRVQAKQEEACFRHRRFFQTRWRRLAQRILEHNGITAGTARRVPGR